VTLDSNTLGNAWWLDGWMWMPRGNAPFCMMWKAARCQPTALRLMDERFMLPAQVAAGRRRAGLVLA
jgi:hypothetical protein